MRGVRAGGMVTWRGAEAVKATAALAAVRTAGPFLGCGGLCADAMP